MSDALYKYLAGLGSAGNQLALYLPRAVGPQMPQMQRAALPNPMPAERQLDAAERAYGRHSAGRQNPRERLHIDTVRAERDKAWRDYHASADEAKAHARDSRAGELAAREDVHMQVKDQVDAGVERERLRSYLRSGEKKGK